MVYVIDFFLCNMLILDIEIEKDESKEMDRKEEGIYESIKEECIANQAENQGNNLTYMYVQMISIFKILLKFYLVKLQ